MSVLKATVGEVHDRRLILELKIAHALAKKIDVAQFEEELEQIKVAISRGIGPCLGIGKPLDIHEFELLIAELRAANSNLWDMENEVRRLSDVIENIYPLAKLAKGIANENDRRRKAISGLDALFGDTSDTKVYS